MPIPARKGPFLPEKLSCNALLTSDGEAPPPLTDKRAKRALFFWETVFPKLVGSSDLVGRTSTLIVLSRTPAIHFLGGEPVLRFPVNFLYNDEFSFSLVGEKQQFLSSF